MNQEEQTTVEQVYASLEEIIEALQSLTEDDYAKIMVIAISFCKKCRLRTSDLNPEDLINEAVLSTLKPDGKRWNKRVTFIKHLDRAMENISFHTLEKTVRRQKHVKIVPFQDGLGHSVEHSDTPKTERNPSVHLEEEEAAKRLLNVLGDDQQAKEVLTLKANGHKPEDIQKQLKITKTAYESITKRIRRKFLKSEYYNNSETI